MNVGKNGPDMGPKHAPPFEFKSESIWTLRHCAFTRKILRTILEKTGKFERENEWGRGFAQTILKIHNVTEAFRIADTPAEPQTDLRW